MTKAELIKRMSTDADITKDAATRALNAFMAGVTESLLEGDGKVSMVGFGTFLKIRRKAKKGRNPRTGEPLTIQERNVVKFVPGKKLKEAL